jgi:hypothetical protein
VVNYYISEIAEELDTLPSRISAMSVLFCPREIKFEIVRAGHPEDLVDPLVFRKKTSRWRFDDPSFREG